MVKWNAVPTITGKSYSTTGLYPSVSTEEVLKKLKIKKKFNSKIYNLW
jgi:hypothetical protein